MMKFNIFDTVQATSTINEKMPSVRGVLVHHLGSFISPNVDCYDGVYVLRRVGKFAIPIPVGHACKILPCRIVLTEKVMVNKELIERLRPFCYTRRELIRIRILETLYQH